MVLAYYTTAAGQKVGGLWDNWETFNRESAGCSFEAVNLKVSGYGYSRKKESARQLAQDAAALIPETSLSCSELAALADYFGTIGRRFGLLDEFRNNGIC